MRKVFLIMFHVNVLCKIDLLPYLFTYSSCDMIGQIPLYFHGNDEQVRDRGQLNSSVKGHLLLQKAGLLVPTIEAAVRSSGSLVLVERRGGRGL